VATLEEIFTEPDKAAGRLVIARVRADADRRSKVKIDTRLVEMALVDTDTAPTGRRLAARLGPHALSAEDTILLGRTVKLADDKLVDDGEPVAVVDVLATTAAALRPTY
jgi:hypothetical protein